MDARVILQCWMYYWPNHAQRSQRLATLLQHQPGSAAARLPSQALHFVSLQSTRCGNSPSKVLFPNTLLYHNTFLWYQCQNYSEKALVISSRAVTQNCVSQLCFKTVKGSGMQEKLPAQTDTYHYFTEAQCSYGKYSGHTAELFSLVLYPVFYASGYFL